MKDFAKRINSKKSLKKNKSANQRFITKKTFKNPFSLKTGLILAIISAIGAFVMWPAVNGSNFGDTQVFYYVLAVLFIVGLGFALQQTAANPFAVSLGDPSTGSNRLNLAGGVNSFGTAIGPILIAVIIFGSVSLSSEEINNRINYNCLV